MFGMFKGAIYLNDPPLKEWSALWLQQAHEPPGLSKPFQNGEINGIVGHANLFMVLSLYKYMV